MELRHLRYFVAVAEERSFVRAAARLHVAQPALSKQIRDLESELGTVLLDRSPRGVRLTTAGRAFLTEARRTLEDASRAVASARGAAAGRSAPLRFAHGELAAYSTVIENLLAAFRDANPAAQIELSANHDEGIFHALRDRQVDVGTVFTAEWPMPGFDAHRIIDATVRGVLLPASHPIAAQTCLALAQLRSLTWLHSGPRRWPGLMHILEAGLRERGLVPERRMERARDAPVNNSQIATGDTWALVSEDVAGPYRNKTSGIVYRPFREPPIPCWLALAWMPPASPLVEQLIETARARGLDLPED